MINFPYTLDQIPPEQFEAMNAYIESQMNGQLLTIAQVKEKYNISTQLQYLLIKDNKIPGHLLIGKTHLYLMCIAKPWFDQYVAKQIARVSAKEAKKVDGVKRGRGRPKKVKGEYTYTLWGQEYKDTRPPGEVEREWKIKVGSYYPHVMKELETPMVLQEAMTHPDLYPDYRDHVRPLFAEIGKLFRKIAAGQE